MKFHADENKSEAVVLGLFRRRLDVTSTPKAGLLGATDAEQLAYCRREGRTLISHDADMLRLAVAGTPHNGIAYCHNQKYKTGELISRLLALSGRVLADEMQNKLEFL